MENTVASLSKVRNGGKVGKPRGRNYEKSFH
jgi:hypothetical protein